MISHPLLEGEGICRGGPEEGRELPYLQFDNSRFIF